MIWSAPAKRSATAPSDLYLILTVSMPPSVIWLNSLDFLRKQCPSIAKKWLVHFLLIRDAFAVNISTVPEVFARETACNVCPLSRVQAGVAVRIKQLCAAPEVQNRLREIGFCEDHIIKLLTSHANFICQVCETRLAISEQLAKIIMVEPVRPAL